MAFDQIHQVGATGQFLEIVLRDTAGALKTGLAATAVTAYYVREGGSAVVAIPLSATTLGTYAAGGWAEADATNMPGVYQLGIPTGVLAVGAKAATIVLKGTGFVGKAVRIVLVGADLRDAAGLGLSRLDAAVSGVGNQILFTPGSKIGADSLGRVTAQAVSNPVTVGTNNDKTGYSLATDPPTVQAIVDGLLNATLAGYSVLGSVGRKLRDWTLGATGKAVLESTERVKLDAAQPDYAPAKPNDVSPTIAFNPTITPTLTPEQTTQLSAIANRTGRVDALLEVSDGHDRFKATALETAPAGGGGGGDGSYTDEDRERDEATAARVAALGGKPSVYVDTIGKGGELTIRRGYARKRAFGNALGPFKFAADLTGATLELRGIGPVSAFVPSATFADGEWTVWFDLDDAPSEQLSPGLKKYLVVAVYPDGTETDPVERLGGPATVM